MTPSLNTQSLVSAAGIPEKSKGITLFSFITLWFSYFFLFMIDLLVLN